ncbi:MAG: sugar phosphate isomerase/epimerase [Acidobacteria bacterium]|nr:sugar phosphate isomerase/epimerase [Acidobacteriota bacterium]
MESKTVLRRHMLGAFAASGLASAAPRYAPKVAAQVYVWTQVFAARKKPLIDGLSEVFETTRKAGYRRMELVSSFVLGEALPRTKELIRKHGIQIPIVYHGGALHEPAAADKAISELLDVAGAAKSIGATILEANPNPKPKREAKTDAELEVQARSINRLAETLSKRGMKLILHHHDPEMANDAREWRHILRNTDPQRVGLCIDYDWVLQAGQEPFALLKEAGPRVESFHLRNARNRVWTQSAGEGDYDYPALARFLKDHGFTGYLVVELAHRKETEITRPLGENLRLSREYVEKTFGLR